MRHVILFVALGGLATCSLGFAQDIGSGGPAGTPSDAISPREERRLERREALIDDTAPTPNLDRQEAAQDRVDENVPGAANVDSEVGRGTSFNTPGAQITLPPAGSGGRVGINVPGAGLNLNVPNPNQWRMQWHRNNWWYWHPNNTWSYWDNNRWNAYGAPNANQQYNSGQNYSAQDYGMQRGNLNNMSPRYGTGYRGQLRDRRNYSVPPNAGSRVNPGGVNAPLYGSGTLSQPDSTRIGQPLNGSPNVNAQGGNPVNRGNNNPSNATGNNLGSRLNSTTSGQLNGSASPAPGSNSTGSGVGATGGGGSQSQSGIITSGPGAGGTTSGAGSGGATGSGGAGSGGGGSGGGGSGATGGGSGAGGGAGS